MCALKMCLFCIYLQINRVNMVNKHGKYDILSTTDMWFILECWLTFTFLYRIDLWSVYYDLHRSEFSELSMTDCVWWHGSWSSSCCSSHHFIFWQRKGRVVDSVVDEHWFHWFTVVTLLVRMREMKVSRWMSVSLLYLMPRPDGAISTLLSQHWGSVTVVSPQTPGSGSPPPGLPPVLGKWHHSGACFNKADLILCFPQYLLNQLTLR